MKYTQSRRRSCSYFIQCAAAIAIIFFVCSTCFAQTAPTAGPAVPSWAEELQKNPELQAALSRLIARWQHELQYPKPRNESPLLALLPASTMYFAAFPNYGDAASQALQIFQEELQKSPTLRDWWQRGPEQAAGGPSLENSLEKICQLSQYLGDEIVVSGTIESSHSRLLIVSQVRKPGLKNVLQQTLNEIDSKSKGYVRVIDPQELTAEGDHLSGEGLVVLVRPDYVVASSDLQTLRSFNAQLDRGAREFGATAFGQRIAQAYNDGVTVLEAADLHRLLSQVPLGGGKNQAIFQSTGFADMKYLVWEHRATTGQPVSQAELSFMGPRHGIASWLAAPAPLGSLDFLSPNAILAGAVQLKDPGQILDDVMEIANTSNPAASAALALLQQASNLSVKDDLLGHLGGEIGFEVDSANTQMPVWKVLLRVNDPGRLQQTLTTLLAMARAESEQSEDGGITYYTVRIPSPKKPVEISYAFVDGYLIVSGNHEGIANAIRLHDSGESLGKSKRFLAALPPGHPSGVSAVLYEDPVAMMAQSMQQLAPSLSGQISQLAGAERPPLLFCAYGEETAIQEASTSVTFDAGATLLVAAIAIPNLLRSRIAANEASAAGSVRTVDTAQVVYATQYPQRGFAPDLATLGPVPGGTVPSSADHAGLLDTILGNPSCTAGAWCTKSGYRFTVKAVCMQQMCADYVVVATPVASDTGERSFCSTSSGVIRTHTGPPLTSPVSVPECRTWAPLR
jgi:hypothetical protein